MSGAKKPMNHRREAKYSILRIKLSGSTPTRFLWVKPHVDGSDHADGTTTIFMAGLPIALSASRLENALLPLFGPVERCVVHRAKTSAIAVFQDAKAVVKLLKFAASKRVVAVPEEEEVRSKCKFSLFLRVYTTFLYVAAHIQFSILYASQEGASYGLKSWVEAHKAERPGQARLQEQLDGWTEAFEMEEENIRREREVRSQTLHILTCSYLRSEEKKEKLLFSAHIVFHPTNRSNLSFSR